MNKATVFLTVLLLFFAGSDVSAQRRRGRSNTPAAKSATSQPAAQPTPTPAVTETPAAPKVPVLLATVNGQNVMSADIDPRAREEIETLDGKIAEARKQILELEINSLLLDIEAAKRKVTPQQVYEVEVVKKLTEPTAAEIAKFIEDNRNQMAQSDPATMQTLVAAYLKGQREAVLSDEFVKRLRASNVVTNGANVNAANLSSGTVLATVAGRTITAGIITERLKPVIYQLRLNAYQAAKPALDLAINDLLLLAESKARNIPPEDIVRKEITEKIGQPSEAEITKFYND